MVNLEIWDQMNNFRRKADLRVSNIQQALQKATFSILRACDKLVDQQPNTDKETLAANINAIVLIWHLLLGSFPDYAESKSNLPVKTDFHSLCIQANESGSRSDLLFGSDLAKQVRDAKDTNEIGKDIGVGKACMTCFLRPYNSHHDKCRPQKNYGKHYRPGESKQPFFWEWPEKKTSFSKNQTERT